MQDLVPILRFHFLPAILILIDDLLPYMCGSNDVQKIYFKFLSLGGSVLLML